MSSVHLIQKRLAFITDCVAEVRQLGRLDQLRNVVVDRYLQVDVAILQRIVERDLDDLLGFVRSIRDRVQG